MKNLRVPSELQRPIFYIVAGVGVALFIKYKLTQPVKTLVTETLNPISDKNIVYKTAGAVVGSVTGSNKSLGSQIYDARPETDNGWLDLVNPVSDQNLAYRAMTGAVEGSVYVGKVVSDELKSWMGFDK